MREQATRMEPHARHRDAGTEYRVPIPARQAYAVARGLGSADLFPACLTSRSYTKSVIHRWHGLPSRNHARLITDMRHIIELPQIGANDESAVLVEWLRAAGEEVHPGQAVCIVETTKSVVEIEADVAGYLFPLAEVGEEVPVGQALAVISADRHDDQDELRAWVAQQQAATAEPAPEQPQRGWTRKAEILAHRHGLDLEAMLAEYKGKRLTEADVEDYIRRRAATPAPAPGLENDLADGPFGVQRAQRLLVIGGGDGAVQVLDAIARTPTQRAVAILDDNATLHGKTVMGVPILGPLEHAQRLWDEGRFDAAVISISTNLDLRARLFETLAGRGIPFANVIAPSVAIHSNVSMGQGNLIMSHTRLGSCAVIGDNNFLSAYVNLEHHNRLGSHCTFGPMVTTSGRVRIGDRVMFGTGIFIEPGVQIGDDCIISSGSILVTDVPARSIVKTRVSQTVRPR
ncbi:MAG: bifunctional N-acetylglucosamine-1-phosphate uridyltransferase/glucosamine-1-phosphate acetyltransferase [Caldilineae bacterium]|nr:MAG: bifunctional N-acetylglucosamine-1-phosphate uridyltransferase/glucosamine-1-phosphate acetyltransferase [Caldilineae bacterium]